MTGAGDRFLDEMLRDGTRHDPYYGQAMLSDHLPMALVSLRRLGAADADLQNFHDRYAQQLEPQRFPQILIDGAIWPEHRGQPDRYPGLRRQFTDALHAAGRDAVLFEWMPRLIDTAGIDAFHPLIRTALAVESGCDEELACALAYWVSAWAAIDVDDGPRESSGSGELFQGLREHPVLAGRPASTAMFGAQLLELDAMPEFQALVRWRGPSVRLVDLAREAARIYLACGHFFALHMVTGTQAAHLLSPWVRNDDRVADAVWMSLAAAYLIIRMPDYAVPLCSDEPPPDRSVVLRAALSANDEHIAKLGYSAFAEWETWRLPEHALILHRIVQGTATLSL